MVLFQNAITYYTYIINEERKNRKSGISDNDNDNENCDPKLYLYSI